MDPNQEQTPEKRQIHYHIGWRSGTIKQNATHEELASGRALKSIPWRELPSILLQRVILRPLPFPPFKAVWGLMIALPAILFCTTVIMIYALLNS